MKRKSRFSIFVYSLEANEQKLAYVLIIPVMILVFGILIYPMIHSFVLSFTDASLLISDLKFVGFKNYIHALKDPALGNSFLVTLKYVILTVSIKLVLAITIALTLKEKFRGRGFVRSLIMVSWATPFIVSGIIWRWMLNPNVGVINIILKKMGIISSSINFISDKNWALPSIIITDVWKGTPFFVIIILAAIQSIDDDLYEAAVIDGAGSFRKFFSITLPLIKFPVFIILIIGTIFAINQFDLFFIMTGGGPADYTNAVTLYNWSVAFNNFDASYSSTVSYVILLLVLIATLIYLKILRKGEE